MLTKVLSHHHLQLTDKHWQWLYLICVISIASLFYKYLEYNALKHSAALFIGIPTFMGIALAMGPGVKHPSRNIFIGMSLGLLSSLVVLKEGSFCVPMTAPLFLGIGAIIGISYQQAQKYKKGYLPVIGITTLLIVISLEGVVSPLTVNRTQQVSTTITLPYPAHRIEQQLAEQTHFSQIPLLLRFGFPQPVSTQGEGLALGSRRIVHFSGGEGQPGNAVFEITARGENWLKFKLIEDNSHISHWLKWTTSEVHWQAIDDQRTQISWIINYQRLLDPAWYFGPIEKYATKLAAQTLIANMATPSN